MRAGPDPDTDAYGHFVIARQLLETPLNFKIHWVWLPLYHALLALPVWLGATLDHVRTANAVAAALPPLLAYWALARVPRRARAGAALPLFAALLIAANPLIMQLGTTGQMEIFFCSLLMLSVGLLSAERFATAALALCALVLTRYEAWAVAAAVAGVLLYRRVVRRSPLGAGVWACMLAPALSVLAWAVARRAGGEAWFSFIRDNQAFAEKALAAQSLPNSGGWLVALGRYSAIVPYRVFGVWALVALLGVRRTLRHEGVWFVVPGIAIVAFLTASSLTRSQLGLERHFAAVVPFAAIWLVHGITGLIVRAGRAWPAGAWPWAPLALVLPLALSSGARLVESMSSWTGTTRSVLREAREIGALLRETPPDSRILCSDAAIEVLSGLGRERFICARLAPGLATRLGELVPSGDLFVVGRARELGPFALLGRVIHGSLEPASNALAVVRVTPERAPDI